MLGHPSARTVCAAKPGIRGWADLHGWCSMRDRCISSSRFFATLNPTYVHTSNPFVQEPSFSFDRSTTALP